MTVIFDTEPLVAFMFDEPGAGTVERILEEVHATETDGYVTTVNLAEIRYVATRRASGGAADTYLEDLIEMGVTELGVDDIWRSAADIKATSGPSLGDAFALAAARNLDGDVTLLVGADDDFEPFEGAENYDLTIERFREEPA